MGRKDFSCEEFAKGLASIQGTPPCPGCRQGGGRNNCEMRACASGRRLEDCSECDKAESCENHRQLSHMRTGAQQASLFVKTRKADNRQLIAEWAAGLKDSWPCCVLFMNDNPSPDE